MPFYPSNCHEVYLVLSPTRNLRLPTAPMNHAKIVKGWTRQDVSWELVPRWYKLFPHGRFLSCGNEEANYVE